ncbi:MAG: hypothetical protein IPI16_16625 [Comamonadaceae bacterium]|jgi:hypothetical protein|nr:hypothetical protein [Comamonadaceae bacterium]HRC64963.1 hypothetical protein [Dermatophilaceae bacterium]
MTIPEILSGLRRLAEEFRALGLSEYARGRADLHGAWCDAARRLDELTDDLED